jgi:transcriptional regulator with XRE-family HTH domain
LLNIVKLESLIKSRGWSKTYFATKFGKNKGWISDMKRGIGLPDENMIRAIADELNTTFEYLTDQSDQKEKPLTEREEPTDLERLLEQQPGLMFHGALLTEDDRAKLITAMHAVMAVEDKKHKK